MCIAATSCEDRNAGIDQLLQRQGMSSKPTAWWPMSNTIPM
jgi:hypothetical protein